MSPATLLLSSLLRRTLLRLPMLQHNAIGLLSRTVSLHKNTGLIQLIDTK